MGVQGDQQAPLSVFIGVDNGVMLRSLVDPVTVRLRTLFLDIAFVRMLFIFLLLFSSTRPCASVTTLDSIGGSI